MTTAPTSDGKATTRAAVGQVSLPAYQRPEPSVAKIRKAEARALMDVVGEAARELTGFVYAAWEADDDPETRAAALDGARECLAAATRYLGLLGQSSNPVPYQRRL